MSHFTDFTGYVVFIMTSFLPGVESAYQCLLNSKVSSCFSGGHNGYKIVFSISNEKRVSPDGRLKTKISPCGSISDLGKLVNSIPENLKALLIHTGANDIELEPDANQIHSKLYDNIMKIRDSHPNLKIILSEITLWFDSLDKDVLRLNAKIFNSFKACEKIFVVHHNNLRKEEFYYDNKHLKRDHIHHLASNMKFGMRSLGYLIC